MKRLLLGFAVAALALPGERVGRRVGHAGVGPPPDDMGQVRPGTPRSRSSSTGIRRRRSWASFRP